MDAGGYLSSPTLPAGTARAVARARRGFASVWLARLPCSRKARGPLGLPGGEAEGVRSGRDVGWLWEGAEEQERQWGCGKGVDTLVVGLHECLPDGSKPRAVDDAPPVALVRCAYVDMYAISILLQSDRC